MKLFLNIYEEIIANTIINYKEDLIQLRNFLPIFSDDFKIFYDFVYEYYASYEELPGIKLVKSEFTNIRIREGNSRWALEEQTLFWKKEHYKEILLNSINILAEREFDENLIKKELLKAEDLELNFSSEQDYQQLADYINYKTSKITDMENFSLWVGSGIDYPSFNQIFANLHNGKTMFMYKFAASLMKRRKKILFISPEMKWQVSIVLIYQFMTNSRVDKGTDLSPRKYQKMMPYLTIPGKDEYIYDVISYLKRTWKNFDVIILDSYYELIPASGSGDEYGAINTITQFLVNNVHKPVFVTTQAKGIAETKKLSEIGNYDAAFTPRGSQASDYNGYLRIQNGVLNLVNLKGRNRDFGASGLPDIIQYNMNIGEGIFYEIDPTQSKFL